MQKRPLQRRLLRQMVREAFRRTAKLYEQQQVNSERSLQAAMWHELRLQFKAKKRATYKIFIEPRLVLPGKGTVAESVRYPDLVVCNNDRVIGIIELKFKPRGRPGSLKDMRTFSELSTHSGLKVANERWEGDVSTLKKYPIEDSALFVWAAIGRVTSAGVATDEAVKARYLRIVYSTVDKTIE